jgi:hypothetical protein
MYQRQEALPKAASFYKKRRAISPAMISYIKSQNSLPRHVDCQIQHVSM